MCISDIICLLKSSSNNLFQTFALQTLKKTQNRRTTIFLFFQRLSPLSQLFTLDTLCSGAPKGQIVLLQSYGAAVGDYLPRFLPTRWMEMQFDSFFTCALSCR